MIPTIVASPREKDKAFKGKARLSPEEVECYRKDNKCFKCGEQGHVSRVCSKRGERSDNPRATKGEAPKEEDHSKESKLSYARGKVGEHDALMLFDPGSFRNFISTELATKLGVYDLEMDVTINVQGYVDKEHFFIYPLKYEEVIIGAPWFDRMAVSMKFPERQVLFNSRGKDFTIHVNEAG